MKNIDLLVNQARAETENEEFSDTTGIKDSSFLFWANLAQERIQSLIVQTHPDIFIKENVSNTQSRVEGYNLPWDTFLGTNVTNVEYSTDGNDLSYRKLKQGRMNERISGVFGDPSFYIRRGSELLLQPCPDTSNAKIRVNYIRALPKLDLRRAKVASVVLTGNEITSLILDTQELIDRDALLETNYISVVDRSGNLKMVRIPIDDINEASGVVSVTAGFEFEDGETIAVGNYLCAGEYSTTKSQLPEVCERYLIQYMTFRAFRKDSNTDSNLFGNELQALEQEIVSSFAEPDQDVDYVPILDGDNMRLDIY